MRFVWVTFTTEGSLEVQVKFVPIGAFGVIFTAKPVALPTFAVALQLPPRALP